MTLREDMGQCDLVFATTGVGLAERSNISNAYLITDCNRDHPLDNLRCVIDLFKVFLKERPSFVISTGAAPGLLGILVGKTMGVKSIWIDSIANSERLSLSGRLAGRVADLWITQWPHLATANGPKFYGSVL
ncbi:glucuronosyltransferase [Pseudomonas sp. ODNR1LW]|nr:glucuronosyltransferase [Pseudomonas sp. ODNR1LW]